MTPEQAREQAVTHISAGWRGDDPIAEKRAQQATQDRQRDTVKDQPKRSMRLVGRIFMVAPPTSTSRCGVG